MILAASHMSYEYSCLFGGCERDITDCFIFVGANFLMHFKEYSYLKTEKKKDMDSQNMKILIIYEIKGTF